MKISAKEKEKVRLEEIEFGHTFRLLNNINNYMKINLHKEKIFDNILCDGTFYCIDLLTGDIFIFDCNLVVERTSIVAKEI